MYVVRELNLEDGIGVETVATIGPFDSEEAAFKWADELYPSQGCFQIDEVFDPEFYNVLADEISD